MREYTPERLRHLTLLAEKYPTALSAYSEIIRLEALLRLPKGTEHFMSDLHGEHEAFIHILNSASGVIREKIDRLLGDTTPPEERADLATLIYYPREKLPELKARQNDLDGWYQRVLLQLIDLCRLVSSKHTRRHVRAVMPKECGHILDELLHAHFEDHDKEQYYGEIIASMLRYGLADQYIIALCEVVKRLAVDRLHIVGDLFDRGPRPDMILERLYQYHDVDFQWGNHDVVWMGAAAGSPAVHPDGAENDAGVQQCGYAGARLRYSAALPGALRGGILRPERPDPLDAARRPERDRRPPGKPRARRPDA